MEIVGELCKIYVKNSELNVIFLVEGNVIRKEKDCILNLGLIVFEENLIESIINCVIWLNILVVELRGLEVKRMFLLWVGVFDFVEVGEKDFDLGEFVLRMNVVENSLNEF